MSNLIISYEIDESFLFSYKTNFIHITMNKNIILHNNEEKFPTKCILKIKHDIFLLINFINFILMFITKSSHLKKQTKNDREFLTIDKNVYDTFYSYYEVYYTIYFLHLLTIIF